MTTLKTSPEVSPGGCWCLELTDALSGKSEACWIENEMGSDEILITFMWVNTECNAMRILGHSRQDSCSNFGVRFPAVKSSDNVI